MIVVLVLGLAFLVTGCQATVTIEIPVSRLAYYSNDDAIIYRWDTWSRTGQVTIPGRFINEGRRPVTNIRNVYIQLYRKTKLSDPEWSYFGGFIPSWSDRRLLQDVVIYPGERVSFEFILGTNQRLDDYRYWWQARVSFDYDVVDSYRY